MYDPEIKLDRFLKTVARRNGKDFGASAIFTNGESVLLVNYGDSFELPLLKIEDVDKIKLGVNKIAEEKFGKDYSIKKYVGSFFTEGEECRCYAFEVGVPQSAAPTQCVWVELKDLENKKMDRGIKRLLRKFIRNKEKDNHL